VRPQLPVGQDYEGSPSHSAKSSLHQVHHLYTGGIGRRSSAQGELHPQDDSWVDRDHDDESITAKLNEVYDNESSALDPVLQNEVLGSGRKSKVTDSLYRANSKIRFQSLSTFALTPARATGRHVDVWTLPLEIEPKVQHHPTQPRGRLASVVSRRRLRRRALSTASAGMATIMPIESSGSSWRSGRASSKTVAASSKSTPCARWLCRSGPGFLQTSTCPHVARAGVRAKVESD
jgi:hypothetical protein